MSAPIRGFVALNGYGQLCFFPGRPGDLADGLPFIEAGVGGLIEAVQAAPEIAHDDDVANLLAEAIAEKASLIPGGTGHPYNTSDEFPIWALWGTLRAGGHSLEGARRKLAGLLLERAREEALERAQEARRSWPT